MLKEKHKCSFANANHKVVGVDVNQELVEKSNQKKLPFEEKGLADLFERAMGTVYFSSEIAISLYFTAEHTENAEAPEKSSNCCNGHKTLRPRRSPR